MSSTLSSNVKTTEPIEFSTVGPAVAFTCITASMICNNLEVDPKHKKLAKNIGTVLRWGGAGLLCYIAAPYIPYAMGLGKD